MATPPLADEASRAAVSPRLIEFWQRFQALAPAGARGALSIRDLLAWVSFVNATAGKLGPLAAYAHGAHLTLLDGLGLGTGLPPASLAALRRRCEQLLAAQLPEADRSAAERAAGRHIVAAEGDDAEEQTPPPGCCARPCSWRAPPASARPAWSRRSPSTRRRRWCG
ncbi:hypothetical protein MNEG_15708 [Monoraphidium neglectum]|uniref:Midasin lid domain-containing protein n=1 Tax=Monoraphidium neglectum TaxID=145388 RepID=A0A0D2LQQ0_9CHLO|nr:hypothetical protein MNEG_15708 [Monoraphidium neglectum]KIY92256.1 hypothetical protein MNEG_15708 [Monoraphidium neglectum]|eukprot:XP_013891276.1 hypothetical protein MNEG_15708 [Monoraphidium neglectum]